jgi:hypothetical protein
MEKYRPAFGPQIGEHLSGVLEHEIKVGVVEGSVLIDQPHLNMIGVENPWGWCLTRADTAQ